jgi:hypothetical protein
MPSILRPVLISTVEVGEGDFLETVARGLFFAVLQAAVGAVARAVTAAMRHALFMAEAGEVVGLFSRAVAARGVTAALEELVDIAVAVMEARLGTMVMRPLVTVGVAVVVVNLCITTGTEHAVSLAAAEVVAWGTAGAVASVAVAAQLGFMVSLVYPAEMVVSVAAEVQQTVRASPVHPTRVEEGLSVATLTGSMAVAGGHWAAQFSIITPTSKCITVHSSTIT